MIHHVKKALLCKGAKMQEYWVALAYWIKTKDHIINALNSGSIRNCTIANWYSRLDNLLFWYTKLLLLKKDQIQTFLTLLQTKIKL